VDRVAALAVSAPEVETLSQWESASLKVLRQKARSGQYTACQNVAAVLNPKRRHARAAPGRAPGADKARSWTPAALLQPRVRVA